MKHTFYVIAVMSNYDIPIKDKVEVSKHEFDETDVEDLKILHDYIEQGEEETNNNLFRKWVYESVVSDYEQHFISCIVLNEEEYESLQINLK